MGCWNGTCGISQLPILCGRKVKAFLMLQSEFAESLGGAGVCYSTAHFRPWFFPVTANYNDYGSIDGIEKDWNSEYMLETFQKWLVEGKVRILSNDEAEINSPNIKKFETLNDVFECVERGALVFIYDKHKLNPEKTAWVPNVVELRIGIFMVLDDIYSDMVAESVRFTNLPDNKYYRDHDVEDRKKALVAINKARGMTTAPDEFTSTVYDLYVDRFLGDLIEEHYAFKHYKRILNAPDKVSVADFMARLDEVRHIGTCMSYLRKLWIPQAGQGSQSEELSFNKALVDAMNEHFDTRAAEEEQNLREEAEWDKKYKAEQAKKKRIASKKKKAKKKK